MSYFLIRGCIGRNTVSYTAFAGVRQNMLDFHVDMKDNGRERSVARMVFIDSLC